MIMNVKFVTFISGYRHSRPDRESISALTVFLLLIIDSRFHGIQSHCLRVVGIKGKNVASPFRKEPALRRSRRGDKRGF